MQVRREGKDKERLFDLQTVEGRSIQSFEANASWRQASDPADLQVRHSCRGCCFLTF